MGMRTISVGPPAPGQPDDLDGRVVEDIVALEQRIVQAIRFRVGEWFLARTRGLDYDMLFGHHVDISLIASTISEAIRIEGGDEITAIDDVTFALDGVTRVYRYSASVRTIYGTMPLSAILN